MHVPKIITAALVFLALAGCATCDRHPVACGIGAALIVGGIAAAVHHDDHNGNRHDVATPADPCRSNQKACE